MRASRPGTAPAHATAARPAPVDDVHRWEHACHATVGWSRILQPPSLAGDVCSWVSGLLALPCFGPGGPDAWTACSRVCERPLMIYRNLARVWSIRAGILTAHSSAVLWRESNAQTIGCFLVVTGGNAGRMRSRAGRCSCSRNGTGRRGKGDGNGSRRPADG